MCIRDRSIIERCDIIMTGLKEEYTKFLADLEKNIKNEEDLNYIKQRFASFVDVIIDQDVYKRQICSNLDYRISWNNNFTSY